MKISTSFPGQARQHNIACPDHLYTQWLEHRAEAKDLAIPFIEFHPDHQDKAWVIEHMLRANPPSGEYVRQRRLEDQPPPLSSYAPPAANVLP